MEDNIEVYGSKNYFYEPFLPDFSYRKTSFFLHFQKQRTVTFYKEYWRLT